MKYSIVIPTYNHCDDLLIPCINSVIQYTDMSDVEIIVVANGCTDNTRPYLDSISSSNIRYLWFDQPLGYTKATNEGIKASSSEFVLLLNNDCVILPHDKHAWIDRLTQPFLEDPLVLLTGSKGKICEHTGWHFMLFFCVLINRKAFDLIGLLDETFNPGFGEDTDFCIKIQKAGFRIQQVGKFMDADYFNTDFPIYHIAEATVHDEANYDRYKESVARNIEVLKARYRRIKYSIIIPTYNHCDDLLKPLINSIFMCTDLKDVEIIVVANGCTDNTREYLKSFTNENSVKYLFFNEPIGFARAVNSGARIATGDYLVLLNNDTILQPQYMNQWLDMLRGPFKDPLMGVTGPSILHFQPLSCDFVVFFCAMIPRLLFNHVGGLSEEYKVGGGEDIEFCHKVQKLNYKIAQVPDTNVSKASNGYIIGKFPIIHKAESTMNTIPDWNNIFHTNMNLVTARNIEQKGIVMIVIPAHNAAGTIIKALKSIEEQNYILWHVVVIDDDSTDNTINVVESIFSEPNFVGKCTLRKTNNHSPSHSRNTAINMLVNPTEYNIPKCDYVAFLDADDWWSPSHLTESLVAIDGYGMSYGPVIAMNEKMEILTPFGIPVDQEPTLDNITKANSIHISTAVLTSECIKTVGYFNPELDSVEDWDYWIRVLKSGRGIHKISTIQAYYLVRDTGMAGKVTPKQIATLRGDSVKLNLGCGDEILPGYINIDINNDKADVEADCTSLPYEDNSIDEVRAYHLIEHFTFQNAFKVLKEWRRVLKPGGRIVLETPDFFHTCKKFVESDDMTRLKLYGHFFAFPDLSPWQVHYFLYTEGQLAWTLRECGFTDVRRETPPDSTYAKANPDWPNLYLKMSAIKPM